MLQIFTATREPFLRLVIYGPIAADFNCQTPEAFDCQHLRIGSADFQLERQLRRFFEMGLAESHRMLGPVDGGVTEQAAYFWRLLREDVCYRVTAVILAVQVNQRADCTRQASTSSIRTSPSQLGYRTDLRMNKGCGPAPG